MSAKSTILDLSSPRISNASLSSSRKISTAISLASIFKSFKRKLAIGYCPSTARSFKSYAETCATLLRRCSCRSRLLAGLALHGHTVKFGISSYRPVFTKLLYMYAECGLQADKNRIFREFAGSDLFSWNFMINNLALIGNIDGACRLFDEMPQRNVVSWTIIVHELMKWGRTSDAMAYFETCPIHSVVSFTAMINGFVQNGMHLYSILLFRRMISLGLMPNEVTFTCLVTACVRSLKFDLARNVVGMIVKTAFDRNVSVCNSLITLFLRMEDYGMARKVFDEMEERDVVSWTVLLDLCFEMGDLKEARQVFDVMPMRNEVTWSLMIARYSQSGHDLEALRLFNLLLRSNSKPNSSSLPSVINSSACLENLVLGTSVHSLVIKLGYEHDVFVASSLIDMYSKCEKSGYARRIFDSLAVKNTVCWNAMIGGYCYDRKMEEAELLFKQLAGKNTASWNAMISGFAHNELYENVLETFDKMLASGEAPNLMTFSSVLLACANMPSLERGMNLHAKSIKLGVSNDVFVGTALIDMYAKSGDIEGSKIMFSMMPEKNEVSWTAMIQGLADSGLAEESLALFEDMKRRDIKPNALMFLSVLFACSHCRLVHRGLHYFESMERVYGIQPKERHYTAMVDLLSRAGFLREAEVFISKMPIDPEAYTWAALLSGCITHGNGEIGEKAARVVIELAKESSAGYVMLSNIYASVGRWKDVSMVRTQMRETGLKKGGGCSWIQIRGSFHAFYSWDSNHPNASEIYEILELLIP